MGKIGGAQNMEITKMYTPILLNSFSFLNSYPNTYIAQARGGAAASGGGGAQGEKAGALIIAQR